MEYPLNSPEEHQIRVIVADNYRLTRQVIKTFLQPADDIEITAEARDGLEALQLTERLHPDVLVISIGTAHLNGLEVTAQIRQQGLATQVVLLSAFHDEAEQAQAWRCGASGYVPTYLIPAELLPAVRAAYHGEIYQSCCLALS